MTSVTPGILPNPDLIVTDPDVRDGLVARRNVLMGLWAAERLGLKGHEAEAYAWGVHLADFDAPGLDDVVAKIAADLRRHGATVCKRTLRRRMREMEMRAELQLAAELHDRR